jgi:hypothetical protein
LITRFNGFGGMCSKRRGQIGYPHLSPLYARMSPGTGSTTDHGMEEQFTFAKTFGNRLLATAAETKITAFGYKPSISKD